MSDSVRDQLAAIIAILGHYECEDCWYSCPKSTEGSCNDDAGDECNCGVEKIAERILAVLESGLLTPALTSEEIGFILDWWEAWRHDNAFIGASVPEGRKQRRRMALVGRLRAWADALEVAGIPPNPANEEKP